MDLRRKEDLARAHVVSISRHEDEDAVIRKAMLARLSAYIEEEVAAIDERLQVRLEAMVSDPAKDE